MILDETHQTGVEVELFDHLLETLESHRLLLDALDDGLTKVLVFEREHEIHGSGGAVDVDQLVEGGDLESVDCEGVGRMMLLYTASH
jgi:hypothetical protein